MRRELKNPQLDLTAFEALSEDQLKVIAQGFHDAHARQRKALHRAIEDSLGFIPALLRIPIKKILFHK